MPDSMSIQGSTRIASPIQRFPRDSRRTNVQNINGTIFVTYAKQDAKKQVSVAGAGNGYVAMFDQTGNLLKNLISQGPLNSPWGLALAPATFGTFGGTLLVGNFGDGSINAFDPISGKQLGTVSDLNGKAIVIPGLWSLNFGSGAQTEDTGTLYFTAGIGDGPNNANNLESHGLLGDIQAAPSFTSTGITNGGSGLAGPLAPNTWIALKGSGMAPSTGNWVVTGATLPHSGEWRGRQSEWNGGAGEFRQQRADQFPGAGRYGAGDRADPGHK